MLFKALITRLNHGVVVSSHRTAGRGSTGGNFYKKYPQVVFLVQDLLEFAPQNPGEGDIGKPPEATTEAKSTQRIFAALEVIQTFGLPDKARSVLKEMLWSHVVSFSWPIRAKAAETLCSVLTLPELGDLESKCLESGWSSSNELHGKLLCLRWTDHRQSPSTPVQREDHESAPDFLKDLLARFQKSGHDPSEVADLLARWTRWLVVTSSNFDVSEIWNAKAFVSIIPMNKVNVLQEQIRLTGPISIQRYLLALQSLPTVSGTAPPSLYVCLYDFLVDDDVSVREAAASATGVLLSNKSWVEAEILFLWGLARSHISSVTPCAAALAILYNAWQVHKTSVILWLEALRRIIGNENSCVAKARLLSMPPDQLNTTVNSRESTFLLPSKHKSFKDMLLETKRFNDDTFVVEKQNLYIDEIQETQRWTDLMERLRPDNQMSFIAADTITWIHKGLNALYDQVCTPMASGPVDWITQKDATILIIRISQAVKMQARWHYNKVHVDWDALSQSRSQIREIYKKGKERLHPLALSKMYDSIDKSWPDLHASIIKYKRPPDWTKL